MCPASLRRQWAQELLDKFNLPSQILDAKTWKNLQKEGVYNPLSGKQVMIMSYHYATRLEEQLLVEPWDLVVIDEAHKLRNAHRTSNKMGQRLKRALAGRKKLLLTATPLQNSLMELYGLSTLIDEHLFGDDKTFRQNYIQGGSSVAELKTRLKGFIHRTLRRDVLEYVRYTQRQTLTVPFRPTTQEQDLYNGISALLERDQSYALPRSQRHLTGLILRKLLASSSHAVMYTLETILKRLESLKEHNSCDYDLVATLVDEDDLEQDYLEEVDDTTITDDDIDLELLDDEINEIKLYIAKAKAIETDSKAKALLIALGQGFEKMDAMGAPRKVIVFTESKRTQEYLNHYLAANDFADKIVTFSGSNNHPQATDVYQRWLDENKDSDKISGSPQIDRRTALIDHFKHHAEIMIATEAAAEGVNLQFCSLLINYDLPWNPQRVEQRIGRCHRYGQKFDVVVINFLNESNKADQRVLELLTEKFHLFDGVFGASDEVLGSIESGLDFEKRIQAIYATCRRSEEIDSAFKLLQLELEADINEKMQATRQLLLENFDEDIHDLLKLRLNAAEQRLDKVGRWFWTLTQHELQSLAIFNPNNHSFQLNTPIPQIQKGFYQLHKRGAKQNNEGTLANAHRYRLSAPLGEWVLQQALNRELLPPAELIFDYSAHNAKVSVVESLIGLTGVLRLQKFSIESLERCEEYLLFATFDKQGNRIPAEVVQKLMQLSAYERDSQQEFKIAEPSDSERKLDQILEAERNQVEKSVNERNLNFFEQEVDKLDTWADDLKEGLEQSIKELDKEIKQVRRDAKVAVTLEEKLTLQKKQKALESQRNKNRRDLFDKQDEVDERREALIEALEGKLNRKTQVETLFTLQWSVK
ncbi:SNF2-related protein [Nitrincola sp. A-D6]|uniref:SNF2-related protein n=1 Tax=Nitrincola sp. A-D6 TaxID=1545442 RepID=UPI002E1151A9